MPQRKKSAAERMAHRRRAAARVIGTIVSDVAALDGHRCGAATAALCLLAKFLGSSGGGGARGDSGRGGAGRGSDFDPHVNVGAGVDDPWCLPGGDP